MNTTLRNRAGRAARKVLSFAAPALVLGLVLVSQVQAVINYPPAPAGTLERAVDDILLKERDDILLQNRLVTQQTETNATLRVLQQQLAQATDPAVIAALQRQIAQQQARFANLRVQVNQNKAVLARDLTVLNPQKDRALLALRRLPTPRNQIRQFIQVATFQQNTYAAIIRAFIRRRPISPVIGL